MKKMLTNSYGWKRTKASARHAFDRRVDKAVASLPYCVYKAIRDCELQDTPQVHEAVYFVVSGVLKFRGGIISKFQAHRHSGSIVDTKPHYRRVYRFPPLKERKVEK